MLETIDTLTHKHIYKHTVFCPAKWPLGNLFKEEKVRKEEVEKENARKEEERKTLHYNLAALLFLILHV